MNGKNHFASQYEIDEATTVCDINGAIRALSRKDADKGRLRREASSLCPVGGIVARKRDDGAFCVTGGDYHSITIAATRRGKTRRTVLPMLQSIILANRSNLIVNDPKGELLGWTHDLLDLMGYEVVVLDFRHPESSPSRFNPIDVAWELWHEGRRDEAVNSLYTFAEVLNYELSRTTNDAYWPIASANLFVGLAVLMLEAGASRDEFNMSSISAMEMAGAKNSFRIIKALCEKRPDSRSTEFLVEAAFAPSSTASSIHSVFRSSIANYVGRESLADMLSQTTCSAREFACRRAAIFVHTPDENSALSPLVIGFINQYLVSLISYARETPEGRLPRDTDVILDEFGNLRAKMPDFDLVLAAACGHGIRLHLVMQSLSQFDYVYGKEMRNIALDNIEMWAFLGSRSLETNEYFSKMLGTVLLPPRYTREPLMDVATLQRLEKRDDESEAIMLIGSLKPFVSPLPDMSCFERPKKTRHKATRAEKATRKVFDIEDYHIKVLLDNEVPDVAKPLLRPNFN